ncbi:MAG TPA: UDP-N-acetylmuramoyl-tripeptide--D-alanyl-D-alanine ligase [Anaerolineales bacterium]|nr:UDP-N-acetylmuramoyl-tripeptide--D-alanyl-D-alanine ligase [Anaerolineales bacterium]
MMLTLADAVEALVEVRPNAPMPITEAAVDSRQSIKGSLFVALRGENADGHDFVQDAFKHGASFALIEHDLPSPLRMIDLRQGAALPSEADLTPPLCLRVENSLAALQQIARFWRRKLSLRVIGITGSVGKSTTKEVIAHVLGEHFRTLRSRGNLNNEIGLPLSVLRLNSQHERAVLEMGFYVPGEIALLCEIALPQVGVVTNIGTVHAERAGSREIIAQGKAELVQSLPAAPEGTAILNFDDPYVRDMQRQTRARVLFYGLTPEAELWADEVEGLGLDGVRFRMHYHKESMHVHIPMIGRHSVETALRATAVGLVEGLSWQEVLTGLSHGHAQLRLVVVRSRTGALLLDDTYNASPESMLAALSLLSEISAKRKIAVLGDMLELGQYEEDSHRMVGMRAAQVADVLVTLGERAHIYAEAARTAGMKAPKVFEFSESQGVIDWLQENLSNADAALLKGSHGLRMDRIVAALEQPS